GWCRLARSRRREPRRGPPGRRHGFGSARCHRGRGAGTHAGACVPARPLAHRRRTRRRDPPTDVHGGLGAVMRSPEEVPAMDRSPKEREELINRAFVTLADTLVDDYDVIDLLDRLVSVCVELLPADAAGIVLGDARRELRAVAASEEAAHVMELLQ